jgi:UPF0755 protein
VSLTRRGKAVVAVLVVVVLMAGAGIGAYLYLTSLGVFGASTPGKHVHLIIPKGSSAAEVGQLMQDKEIIPSELGFRIYLKIHGVSPNIEAGTYDLRRGLNVRDALAALVEQGPHVSYVRVTFPEGSWVTDFARILGRDTHILRKSFLRVAHSGDVRSRFEPGDVNSLEGLLFPSTYQIVTADTAASVVRRLVDQFDTQVSTLDLSSVHAMGYTPYQAIIVASMVEAEAKVDQDRPKIAEVIYNRLRQGIALGIDATVDYALGHHVTSLTETDLAVDSPYNTRLHSGLPPTPIGAPGLSSLRAAARPARGNLLYYVVADCHGHHFFSSSYSAFIEAKKRYQALSC